MLARWALSGWGPSAACPPTSRSAQRRPWCTWERVPPTSSPMLCVVRLPSHLLSMCVPTQACSSASAQASCQRCSEAVCARTVAEHLLLLPAEALTAHHVTGRPVVHDCQGVTPASCCCCSMQPCGSAMKFAAGSAQLPALTGAWCLQSQATSGSGYEPSSWESSCLILGAPPHCGMHSLRVRTCSPALHGRTVCQAAGSRVAALGGAG